MTDDETLPDQSVSGSSMGVIRPLSRAAEQIQVGSSGIAALDSMKAQQDSISKTMKSLSGLNSPVMKMFADMQVPAMTKLNDVMKDYNVIGKNLSGLLAEPPAMQAAMAFQTSSKTAGLTGLLDRQDSISKTMKSLSGLNSPVMKMFADMQVSPSVAALADALEARRVLEEVRYLEDLLADSPDGGHKPRGLRGMSDEDLERLGSRLLQLPATTLALVMTVTLVSHPMLFAYVSAALLSWQAKEKVLAALRRLA